MIKSGGIGWRIYTRLYKYIGIEIMNWVIIQVIDGKI